MPDPKKLYRWLLKLYPARFREEYEVPLQRQFLDEYQEIQGRWGRLRFWIRAWADLAISIPRETLRELRQDLVYAMRVYRRRSVSAVLAVVALALAIGATTGVFSVVNALLLRSLPFRNPERLVELRNFYSAGGGAAAFNSWRNHSAYLEEAALYRTEQMNLGTTHEAQRVTVAETSATFFRLLGKDPEIGRPFLSGEDTPGRDHVAVIGYGLWQQFFGGVPGTLGSTIHVNGVPLTVIGIAPPGLDYPDKSAMWTPTVFDMGELSRARALMSTAIGRLKPGVTFAQAVSMYQADMAAVHKGPLEPAEKQRLQVTSLRNQLAGDVRKASLVLLGVVLFVLLTACANVAHLLLSRITERRPEMVLRAALGASRSRLLQQLITESTLLTLCAAAAGLVVAQWASRLAASVQPARLAVQDYSILDWPVLGFAMGIAVLTGFVFGVLPANLISRMQPGVNPLRTQSGGHDRGVRRMRAVLIAMQTTLTLVLLAGSLTMGRSFLRLAGTDLGLRTDHVVTMSVSLSGTPREGHQRTYYREALERLRAVPGVESAGAAEYLPLTSPIAFAGFRFKLDNQGGEHLGVIVTATPDYLRAMGTEILAGRDFTAAEEQGSAPVAIVNETFARQFDPTLRLAGRTLPLPAFFRKKPLTIVGVARTERYLGPTDPGTPQIFVLDGWSPVSNMTFVARVRGKTEAYLPICRDAVQSVDPKVPVFNVETFERRLNDSLARPRFYTTLVVFFGGFALLLAVVGVYGVASFSVAQRAHEIGVRMAVGASPRRLRAMLLRESLLPVGAGMAGGVAAAAALGALMEHLMNGADAIGPATCALAAAVLLAVASVAVWTATRRIVRLDPMRILRAE